MRQTLTLIAAAAMIGGFGFATSSMAADGYSLDTKGKCHNAAGKFVKTSMCHAASAGAKKKQCRDAKGKFMACAKTAAAPATPATPAKPAAKATTSSMATTAAKPATAATPPKK